MTVTKLASLASISPAYLSALETGKKLPTPKVIRCLSGALDIHSNVLFEAAGILIMPLAEALRDVTVPERFTIEVNEDERERVVAFLEFLRFRASIGGR